jgi:hypothetical protein
MNVRNILQNIEPLRRWRGLLDARNLAQIR